MTDKIFPVPYRMRLKLRHLTNGTELENIQTDIQTDRSIAVCPPPHQGVMIRSTT